MSEELGGGLEGPMYEHDSNEPVILIAVRNVGPLYNLGHYDISRPPRLCCVMPLM